MMNDKINYDLKTIDRLENRFLTAYHNGDYENACKLGEYFYGAIKKYCLSNSFNTFDNNRIAEAEFQLGCAYDEAEKTEKAIELYSDTIGLYDEKTCQTSAIYANACNNLGILYADSNKLDKAVLYLSKSYNTRQNILPYGDKDLIDICYNLALTYSRLANAQKANISNRSEKHSCIALANKFYAKALNMRTKYDMLYADNIYNLGVSYIADSADEVGLFFISKALDVYKSVADDPDEYAAALSFYCSLLQTIGYEDKALDAYKALLEWQNLHFSTAYLPISGTLSGISKCCAQLGDYFAAIEYKKKSIATMLKGFINKPLMYTMSVAELGSLYTDVEDYNQAEAQFKEALEVRTYLLSADDEVCISYVFALCNIYTRTKQYKKAELLLCHTLDILQPNNPIYTELALTLVAIYMEAEDGSGIRRAYELFIKAHPEKGFDEMLDMAEDIIQRLKSIYNINNLLK